MGYSTVFTTVGRADIDIHDGADDDFDSQRLSAWIVSGGVFPNSLACLGCCKIPLPCTGEFHGGRCLSTVVIFVRFVDCSGAGEVSLSYSCRASDWAENQVQGERMCGGPMS